MWVAWFKKGCSSRFNHRTVGGNDTPTHFDIIFALAKTFGALHIKAAATEAFMDRLNFYFFPRSCMLKLNR